MTPSDSGPTAGGFPRAENPLVGYPLVRGKALGSFNEETYSRNSPGSICSPSWAFCQHLSFSSQIRFHSQSLSWVC